ncbi:TolC family protein [Cupriavidus sp. AU9028]|uniref:TolC family protein n=1 Tax=Cupriavidus sp. AU9028 TaxID=2871157 RepID=UPI001C96615D|nr:TolC family protein [Cupriavidus sp. AU9028]MBY4895889.1 TolC family protein [Cupriavidus sp. AU9028]
MRRLVVPLGLAAILFVPFSLAAAAAAGGAPFHDPTLAPEPAEPLTLEAALTLAEAGNPTLAAAAKEVEATQGAVIQAATIPNPQIVADTEGVRSATRTSTAQVQIPLELGGKRSARVTAAERGREVARAELNGVRAELRANAIAAFFAVLVAQERRALASGSLDIAARGAAVAAGRVAAGKVPPLEQTRAEVEQANAQLELAQAEAELRTARVALAALWGNTAPRFTQAVGDLAALPSRPAGDALQARLEGSPLLAASRLAIERREAQVAVERSRRYPDITVSVGAQRDNEVNRNMAVLGVAIPLPLFDRNQGNLYEAIRRADKAQDEYRATQIRLRTELLQASNQLDAARVAASTLRTTVLPGAERAYQVALRGFEAGKFGFLDVLDAQRTLFQARLRYLDVLARTYQAATSIDRIVGQ